MIKEFIRDKVKVIVHYGKEHDHCVSGTIASYDEYNETIHLMPEGSSLEMALSVHSIIKIEMLNASSHHDLLAKHETLTTDVDFDNAILLHLPVSVWHGGYRVRSAAPLQSHDDQTVIINGQMYDKASFLFRIERSH